MLSDERGRGDSDVARIASIRGMALSSSCCSTGPSNYHQAYTCPIHWPAIGPTSLSWVGLTVRGIYVIRRTSYHNNYETASAESMPIFKSNDAYNLAPVDEDGGAPEERNRENDQGEDGLN